MTDPQSPLDPAQRVVAKKSPPATSATVSQMQASIETSQIGGAQSPAASSKSAETPIPQTFGRYKIDKELGKGAMGVVYLAEDTQLGRKVALKIPKKAMLEDPETLERFYREAKTTATLRHNNICPVYDVGAIDGTHYLTMAYIPGKPVSSFLAKGKVPAPKQTALLIRKIALALGEAHKQGVIHRDLKPSNVMLDDRGEPIVMDFGLARNTNTTENARLTQSGAIMGTPAYMSPEQVRGETDQIGPASDIYALGVMMYQLLTGELPFSGPIMLVFAQIVTQEPKRPSEVKPGVDLSLEAICLKMMAKEVDQRYASMKDAAAALTEYLKTGSVTGLEAVAGGRFIDAVPPVPTAPAVDFDAPTIPPGVGFGSSMFRSRSKGNVSLATPDADWPRRRNWWSIGLIRGLPGVALISLLAMVLFAIVVIVRQKDGTTLRVEINQDSVEKNSRPAADDKPPESTTEPQPNQKVSLSNDSEIADFIKNPTFADSLDGWNPEGGAKSFRKFTLKDGQPALTTFGDKGDKNTGRIYQQFRVPANAIALEFLIGGGAHKPLHVSLREGEQTRHTARGHNRNAPMTKVSWNLRELRGKAVTLEIVDQQTASPWGFIGVSGFRIATDDTPQTSVSEAVLEPSPASNIPADTKIFNGHAYKFFPEKLPWQEAKARCANLRGQLLVIENAEENAFAAKLIEEAGWKDCWIGVTDELKENEWRTPSGQPVTFTNWYKDQPKHQSPDKHYGLMSNRQFGKEIMGWKWCDQPNAALSPHEPGFICEWEAEASENDRTAAQSVLAIGGEIEIRMGEQTHSLQAPHALPEESFQLERIAIRDKTAQDISLIPWHGLKNLQSLTIANCPIGDAGLPRFRNLTTLTELNLSGTQLTDDGLAVISGLAKLTKLDLSLNRGITDAGISHLTALPHLQVLELIETSVGDGGMRQVAALPELDTLNITFSAVTDGGLAHVKDMKLLRCLDVGGSRISDAGLVHLKDGKIEWLGLDGTFITDAGMPTLKTLRKLRGLGVANNSITDQGLKSIAECYTLQELNLRHTEVSDAGLASFPTLSRLYLLELGETAVTDGAIEHLSKIPNLKWLRLGETRISADGFSRLKAIFPEADIQWSPADPAAAKPAAIPADAKIFNGHAYKFFSEKGSWQDAEAKCVNLGGHLIVINHADENAFAAKLIEGAGWKDCWVGATDELKEGTWTTALGDPAPFLNWYRGQPNNKPPGEHYALMSSRQVGKEYLAWKWSDQPNAALPPHEPGFICEWETSPQQK